MRHLIAIIAAASLLAGCTATATTAAPATPAQDTTMQTSTTLLPQRSADAGGGATLRYDGAADSRCPPDVRCIVAGEISYRFTLTGSAGSEAFTLTKARPVFDATTFKGVRVTLGETAEPPLRPSTASTPVVIMPVTITISHP